MCRAGPTRHVLVVQRNAENIEIQLERRRRPHGDHLVAVIALATLVASVAPRHPRTLDEFRNAVYRPVFGQRAPWPRPPSPAR